MENTVTPTTIKSLENKHDSIRSNADCYSEHNQSINQIVRWRIWFSKTIRWLLFWMQSINRSNHLRVTWFSKIKCWLLFWTKSINQSNHLKVTWFGKIIHRLLFWSQSIDWITTERIWFSKTIRWLLFWIKSIKSLENNHDSVRSNADCYSDQN